MPTSQTNMPTDVMMAEMLRRKQLVSDWVWGPFHKRKFISGTVNIVKIKQNKAIITGDFLALGRNLILLLIWSNTASKLFLVFMFILTEKGYPGLIGEPLFVIKWIQRHMSIQDSETKGWLRAYGLWIVVTQKEECKSKKIWRRDAKMPSSDMAQPSNHDSQQLY